MSERQALQQGAADAQHPDDRRGQRHGDGWGGRVRSSAHGQPVLLSPTSSRGLCGGGEVRAKPTCVERIDVCGGIYGICSLAAGLSGLLIPRWDKGLLAI